MDLGHAFRTGGWGMWPTLVFGVLLLGAGALCAVRPQKRFVPLFGALGVITMVSGLVGFVTGVIRTFAAIGQVGPDRRFIALIGVAESAYNVVFALVFVLLAAILAGIGAARIARRVPSGVERPSPAGL